MKIKNQHDMKNLKVIVASLIMMLIGIAAQAQTYAYNHTKSVTPQGVPTRAATPNAVVYFAFNGNVAYRANEDGTSFFGGIGAYQYKGKNGDSYVYEYEDAPTNNPFVANMYSTSRQMSGIYYQQMLVSTDRSVINIVHYDKNGQLVRTDVYNQVVNTQQNRQPSIPSIIR